MGYKTSKASRPRRGASRCLVCYNKLLFQGAVLVSVGAPEPCPGHLLLFRPWRLQTAPGAPEEDCNALTYLGFVGSSPDSNVDSRKLGAICRAAQPHRSLQASRGAFSCCFFLGLEPNAPQSFRPRRSWRRCVPRVLLQLGTRPWSVRPRQEKPVTSFLTDSTTQRAGTAGK